MNKLFAFLALVLLALPVFADFHEGTEYQALATPQPTSSDDKIEVLELFWYGCPHCFHLEPELNAWLKHKPDDVVFVRVPAVLGPSWELLARAYYTADLLGALDKIHEPLFEHIHNERKLIRNASELKAFFVQQGVSEADFDKTFNSFAVVTMTNRAREARTMYGDYRCADHGGQRQVSHHGDARGQQREDAAGRRFPGGKGARRVRGGRSPGPAVI